MNKKLNEHETRFSFATQSIKHLVRGKLLFNMKDHVGIILKGTEECDNPDNEPNISICSNLDFPTMDLLDLLDNLQPTEEEAECMIQLNLVFASIEIAIKNFVTTYGKKKWNKKIFIFTDCESRTDETKLDRVIDMIEGEDVKVNIITIDEEENGLAENSKNQIKTKFLLKQLEERSSNVSVLSNRLARNINKQFRKKKVTPTIKYRGPLIITPNLYIDVCAYTKSAKVYIPSLKKYSMVSDFSKRVKTNEIKNEKVYYVHDDPDQNPLTADFMTKAHYYGKSLVPVSKTDEVLFNNEEDKCLKAIGFTDNYRVPRHHFLAGTDLIISNPTSSSDFKAFTVLIQEMINTNKVLICRYVFKKNSNPKLVVLTPHISKSGPILYLNTLPTVEYIRDYQFESLKECSMQQEEVASKFIDSLDLDEDEEGEEKLKPTATFNPSLQYFYQCLEHKALNRENNIPDLDDTIEDYLKPDKKIFENNKYVTFLPKMFEIKERHKEEKKKRVFWKEMINNEIQDNTGISDRRLEEKLEKNKEEAKKIISMTRPIEDFKEMLNYKYEDLTESAIGQMKSVIVKFILESFKGSYYIKALDCLKELRDACIQEDEIELFNLYMEEFKQNFPKEKFVDLWRIISDNKITLISNSEHKNSKFSDSDAKDWLENIMKKEIITSTFNDIDNLIADID